MSRFQDLFFCSKYLLSCLGNRYITGKSYGATSFNSRYNFFPSWKLETWNSFCVTADSATRVYKTFINGKAGCQFFQDQGSPLSLVEVRRCSALIGREKLLRQQSYAIENQLVASKASRWFFMKKDSWLP